MSKRFHLLLIINPTKIKTLLTYIKNCMENDDDIFSEIMKHRGKTVDGKSDEDTTFATIYEKLFNSEKDGDKINHL